MLSIMDGSWTLCSFASFAHSSPYITQTVSKLLESWNLTKAIMTLTLMPIDVRSCWGFGRSNLCSWKISRNIKFYWALCICTSVLWYISLVSYKQHPNIETTWGNNCFIWLNNLFTFIFAKCWILKLNNIRHFNLLDSRYIGGLASYIT